MEHYIFLGRTKDEGICYYTQDEPAKFECGHYFASPYLTNASCLIHDFPKYENLETVLSKDEYNRLLKLKDDIYSLGFGIRGGDERYKRGLELRQSLLNDVYAKLTSPEAEKFFNTIVEDEKKKLAELYNLKDYQVDQIFDESPSDYKDAGIVIKVCYDSKEIAEDFIDNYYPQIDDMSGFKLSWYIDYEKLGDDLVQDSEDCLKLNDGRIVQYYL